jgi:hypothetical protein
VTEAADPLGALRDYLLNDPSIVAAVADRVYCLSIRDDEVKQMPQAAIVLKPAGGPGARGYQQFGKKRIDVTCHGSTLDESWDVYLTMLPVLQQLTRIVSQSVLLHSATIESAGAAGINPLTNWPTTYSSWLVQSSDIAAT